MIAIDRKARHRAPSAPRPRVSALPWTFGSIVAAVAAFPSTFAPLLPYLFIGAFVVLLLERGYLGSGRSR